MDKTKVLLIIAIVFCIASVSKASNVIYVDVNGPNDPGAGIVDDPFRRIQAGIDAAVNGDTVQILPGVYTGEGNYGLDPGGKAITIRSIDPDNQNIVENTILDPGKAGRGFQFVSGEGPSCTISGLTIKNGLAADDSGGAILCYNSSPTIGNCIIRGNTADYGGALFCNGGSPQITNCTITGNSAIDGGAIECWAGTTVVRNCVISNNTASNNGGAINCYLEGQAQLYNCTVVTNSAGTGGALHCIDNGKAAIQDSIIWSNRATKGTQVAVESSPFNTSQATISYSNVQGGISEVHVAPEGILNWGDGNIDTAPNFAMFDPDGDPDMWDFHLQSLYGRWDPNSKAWVYDANTSLCIDAGDQNSDWSDEPWPNGKRINMGAYGGTSQASKNGNPADFDINGAVNLVDFASLAGKWMIEGDWIEDLSLNGVVDIADLRQFADNWLWKKE